MSTQGTELRRTVADAIALLAQPVAALEPHRLSADEYVAAVQQLGDLARVVAAAEIALAGEAPNRSSGRIDTLGALGHATPVDAVATLTASSARETKRRIRLGAALNTGSSLTGAETGSPHPHVAGAVSAGTLGPEAALILVDALDGVSSRVDAELVLEAEESLVRLAAGTPEHPPLRPELVRDQAEAFVAAIDPDGVLPREEWAHRQRRLLIGNLTHDGLIPVHGLLSPEIGATLTRLTDAHMRTVTFTDEGHIDPVVDSDRRTPGQKRHDSLADVLSAAVRVADAPELAGGAPAITVIVAQSTLDEGRGVGVIEGVHAPISIEAVDRFVDTRGIQLVTLGEKGRVLSLGSAQRYFTGSQRRAITARDGGCVIPGCPTPAGWCEVHHVIPWREGGKTHTDNGVLLCWGHHRIIDSGPWRLSMPDGVPHVRGPGYRQWTHTTKSRVRPPGCRADDPPSSSPPG